MDMSFSTRLTDAISPCAVMRAPRRLSKKRSERERRQITHPSVAKNESGKPNRRATEAIRRPTSTIGRSSPTSSIANVSTSAMKNATTAENAKEKNATLTRLRSTRFQSGSIRSLHTPGGSVSSVIPERVRMAATTSGAGRPSRPQGRRA